MKLGFVCAVEVGNADDVYVELYNDGDLKPTASSGKAFWEVNEDNLDFSLETRTIKSNSYYELGASTADKVNNNEQKCKFILDVDKGTKGLFQNYDVSLGLFVYDDTFSDTMAELSTADITMELKAPKIKQKPIAKSTYKDVEIGEGDLKDQKVTSGDSEKTALGLTSGDIVETDIKVEYLPIKEAGIPDQFVVNFITRGPTAMVKDGDKVFNYLSFREKDSSDPYTTVGCVTEIGNAANTEIISWESATKFDSTS